MCMPQRYPDPQCWTLDRQLTPSGSTSWHYDRDRQRCREMKMETDEDEDRLTLGTSEVAAPLQLMTPQSDEDRTWYFSSHVTCWLPSPWRMQWALQPQVQSWNHPSPVVPELAFRKMYYEALTVPSGYANWSDRGLTTKVSALRPKLNDVPDSLLCPKQIFFSVL